MIPDGLKNVKSPLYYSLPPVKQYGKTSKDFSQIGDNFNIYTDENWSTKRNLENSTNFKVSLAYYFGISTTKTDIKINKHIYPNCYTSKTKQKFKPSRPSRVNYVTIINFDKY